MEASSPFFTASSVETTKESCKLRVPCLPCRFTHFKVFIGGTRLDQFLCKIYIGRWKRILILHWIVTSADFMLE
jgi:hypothetical protein